MMGFSGVGGFAGVGVEALNQGIYGLDSWESMCPCRSICLGLLSKITMVITWTRVS